MCAHNIQLWNLEDERALSEYGSRESKTRRWWFGNRVSDVVLAKLIV